MQSMVVTLADLPAGAAPQLVVDAPRVVQVGADDVQPAQGEHLGDMGRYNPAQGEHLGMRPEEWVRRRRAGGVQRRRAGRGERRRVGGGTLSFSGSRTSS